MYSAFVISIVFLLVFNGYLGLCYPIPGNSTDTFGKSNRSHHDQNIFTIDINLTDIKWNDINYYKEFNVCFKHKFLINIECSITKNELSDIGGFGIIQLHSFNYNLSFNYFWPETFKEIQIGTHTGFIVSNLENQLQNKHKFYIINNNMNVNVSAALVLVIYRKLVPRPGICSLTSEKAKPTIDINMNDPFITIDTHPGGYPTKIYNHDNGTDAHIAFCSNITLFKYETFFKLLTKYDFTEQSYFKNIKDMILPRDAISNSRKNNLKLQSTDLRKLYQKHSGVPMVFVTIISTTDENGFSSNYIPMFSYSCKPTLWNNECYYFTKKDQLILTSIVFILVLICIIWSYRKLLRLVKFGIIGATIGIMITLLILRKKDNIESDQLITYSALGAVIGQTAIIILDCYYENKIYLLIDVILTLIINHIIITTLLIFFMNNFFNFICFITITVVNISLLICILYYKLVNFVLITVNCISIINIYLDGNYHLSILNHINFLIVKNNYYKYVNLYTLYEFTDFLTLILTVVILIIIYKIRLSDYIHIESVNRDESGIPRRSRFYRDPTHKPLITRWTDGDDEVFETPKRNARYFNQLKVAT